MDTATPAVSALLADKISSSTYADIDPRALEYGKTLILDILGNAIAGASLDLSIGLLETARSWGRGDVPVWADGSRLTAPDAVLVNSHRAHSAASPRSRPCPAGPPSARSMPWGLPWDSRPGRCRRTRRARAPWR